MRSSENGKRLPLSPKHDAPQPSSPEPEPSPSNMAPLQTATPHKVFNLDNVPGSDKPAHDDTGHDVGVNDPDAILKPKRTGTPDLQYFFDRTGVGAVCKLCRYVSYC